MKFPKIHFKLLILVLMLFVIGCSCTKVTPISKEQIKNVSFNYDVNMDGFSTVIKYWMKDTKMKIQLESGVIYYFDSKDNATYTYTPGTNTAIKEPEPMKRNEKDIPPPVKDIPNNPLSDYFEIYEKFAGVEPKATEDIEGIQCYIYDFSTKSSTYKYFISKKDGFPISWEYISLIDSPSKCVHKVIIKNLEFNNVTDEEVNVPSSANVVLKK